MVKRLTTLFPAYFPSLIWWKKMMISDSAILLDGPVYSQRSGINKTWIKTADGRKRLTVPVLRSGQSVRRIKDIRIDPANHWYRTHPASLRSNYRNAPYFEHYYPYFSDFYAKQWVRLVDLCIAGIRMINKFLRWPDKFTFNSELGLTGSRESRVRQAMQVLHCDTYVIEENGEAYFDHRILLDHGSKVELIQNRTCKYNQQFGDFVPDLSILDLLMNEGPYAAKFLTDSCTSSSATGGY